MNELCSGSVANIHKSRLREFKRLAEGLLSAIRENDSDTSTTRSSSTSPRESP